MCQISVVLEEDGNRETVMENVTRLDVTEDGVVLSSFFDEPRTVARAVVGHIDFLGGTVVLHRNEDG